MQRDIIYRQKEGVSTRKLGDELMLYDEASDKVHILNETGILIWGLLNGENNLLDIENSLIRQFPDAKPEEISRDISEIIEKLLSEGLCY